MKKFKYSVGLMAVVLFGLLTLVACNKTEISVNGGKIEEKTVLMEVGTTVSTLDLAAVVSVSKGAEWQVYEDEDCTLAIPDKKVSLGNGDNEFYISVKSKNNSEVYTLKIWKNFYAKVDYYVNGEFFDRQEVLSHTYMEDFRAPENLVGMEFLGWECEGHYVEDTYLRFDAKLEYDEYLVMLNTDGGTCSAQAAIVMYGLGFKFPVPQKEGYKFYGWKLNGKYITDNKGNGYGVWKIDDDAEVTADWSVNSYYVYFQTDGSGGGEIGTSYAYNDSFYEYGKYGTEITVIAETKSQYFTFAGWYEDEKLISEEESLTVTIDTKERTYTAKWQPVEELSYYEWSYDNGVVIDGVKDKSVSSAVIPDCVKKISEGAFDDCENLAEITVSGKLLKYLSADVLKRLSVINLSENKTFDVSILQACDNLAVITLTDSETNDDNYVCRDGILYTYSYGSVRNIAYVPNLLAGEVSVPGGITSVSDAFAGRAEITSIRLPNNIYNIDDYAFSGCTKLSEIYFPSSIASVGENAFEGTQWFENLPDGIVYINKIAYKVKHRTSDKISLSIEDGTTSISVGIIDGCVNLVGLSVPDSVREIKQDTFKGCESLESITLPFIGGSRFSYEVFSYAFGTVPESLKSIVITGGNKIPASAFADLEHIVSITVSGNSVKEIEYSAFKNCSSLEEINLPNCIQNIWYEAFENCVSLSTVVIPENAIIDSGLFKGCTSLTSISIPWDLDVNCLGDLFDRYYGSGGNANVPQSLKRVEVTGTSGIGSAEFANCNYITEIVLSDSITQIGQRAFEGCSSLETIKLPDRLESIGYRAFGECKKLREVTMPTSLKVIDANVFENCINLESIELPNNLETIRRSAFSNCAKLTEISIPESVQKIESNAFSACTGLQSVYITSLDKWMEIEFGSLGANPVEFSRKLYVNGVVLSEVEFPQTMTEIKTAVFSGCETLKTVTLHDGIEVIGLNAFRQCSGIESIALPVGLTKIYGGAFNGCSGITQLDIPETVIEIGDVAFKGLSVTEIAIPDGITRIESHTFEDCLNLTDVYIPQSVTSIGQYAFAGCASLKEISLPDYLTEIASYTFMDCTSLESIVIPQYVTKIGFMAFCNCSKLSGITLGAGLKTIEGCAFSNCVSLSQIVIPDGVETIEYDAFRWSGIVMAYIPASVVTVGSSIFWYCNELETVYCEATSKPEGWSDSWLADCNAELIWGYIRQEA